MILTGFLSHIDLNYDIPEILWAIINLPVLKQIKNIHPGFLLIGALTFIGNTYELA